MTPHAISQAFLRARSRIDLDDLHFHDLRHEAVTRFFEKGLNVMEVSAISGHKTLQMLSTYTHLKAEDLARKLG
jgi:integrase